jgi:uncharacterized protein YcfJ
MSLRSAFVPVAAVVGAIALTGCATNRTDGLERQQVTVNNDVRTVNVQMNPCDREGIKLRPVHEVSHAEITQRFNSGESYYVANNHYLFAEKSLIERFGAPVAALAGGALASQIGSGGARIAATIAGAAAGGIVGDRFAEKAKLERLASENGCEAYAKTLRVERYAPPINLYSYQGGYLGPRPTAPGYYPNNNTIGNQLLRSLRLY